MGGCLYFLFIMLKPSVTIHKSPEGELKVLVCSEDANECLIAYKGCTEPGEVIYIRKGFLDKRKKVIKQDQPKEPVKKVAKKAAKKRAIN